MLRSGRLALLLPPIGLPKVIRPHPASPREARKKLFGNSSDAYDRTTQRTVRVRRLRLDALERRLLRHGEPVPLEPKVFETLLVLVRHERRLVGKAELMQAVWPDSFVEESNLTRNISVLRKALSPTRRCAGVHRNCREVRLPIRWRGARAEGRCGDASDRDSSTPQPARATHQLCRSRSRDQPRSSGCSHRLVC